MSDYQPPLTLTAAMLALVAEISEQVGRLSAVRDTALTPQLRRGNRIRTIQASLAIENNSLSLEQVTAVLDGKQVLGLPREIQEVRNAFAAYEAMPHWQSAARADLLKAHGLLMQGLIDDAGQFRQGGVGIYRGERLLHMAPPANRVGALVDDLLGWLARTDLHPLIASCVFHYEFEFIHPFADGNGRMGRLWQTLILSQWRPILAYLPVETVIRAQQEAYYAALSTADQLAEATPFVEFMLRALQQALLEAAQSDQVDDQVSDQVKRLLRVLKQQPALKAAIKSQRPASGMGQELRRFSATAAGVIPLGAGLAEYSMPARSEGGFSLPAIDPSSLGRDKRALPQAVPDWLRKTGSFPVARPNVKGTYTETVRVPAGTTLSVVVN